MLLGMGDNMPLGAGHSPFFCQVVGCAALRVINALSSIASAKRALSREISSLNNLSRRGPDTSKPPNFDFYLKKAAEHIPWRRQASSVVMPTSCFFMISMICSSLNLLRFISFDCLRQILPKNGHISGGTPGLSELQLAYDVSGVISLQPTYHRAPSERLL